MREIVLDESKKYFYYVLCECCLQPYLRVYTWNYSEADRIIEHCEECIALGFHDNSIYNSPCSCIDIQESGQYTKRKKNKKQKSNKIKNKQKGNDVMNTRYVAFSKEEFELEIQSIAFSHGLSVREVFKQGVYERMYDMTTENPAIRCLIYSTLSTRDAESRESGEDAVRVQLWIKTEDGIKFKNFKRHYRTAGFFKNLAETINEIQEYVNSDKATKWLYAANKAAREKTRKDAF